MLSTGDSGCDAGTEFFPSTKAEVTVAKIVEQSLDFISRFDRENVPKGISHAAHQLGSKFSMCPKTSTREETITS